MNIENTRKALAYFAELDESRFDMRNWFITSSAGFGSLAEVPPAALHKCGTTACIAGHVQWGFARTEEEKRMCSSDFAREFLDLTDDEAYHLFYARFWDRPTQTISQTTLDQAIEELKRMAAS